jgi:diguanylate cyclase (GGDEF)-like protein
MASLGTDDLQPAESATEQLARFAGALGSSLAGGGVAPFIVGEVARLEGVLFAAFLRHGEHGFVQIAGRGVVPVPGPVSAPVARAAAGSTLARASAAELAELGPFAPGTAVFASPLRDDRDQVVAVLLVGGTSERLSELERRVVALTELASALLANERRLALSAAEARRDPLTGLGNRRAFEEQLERALGACAASEQPLSVVFCDLDDFKRVNESGGYQAGDRVLSEVARALAGQLRPEEQLFRLGGDEFAAVVRGDARAGDSVAERLAAALLCRRRSPRLPTLSTGMAVFPCDGLAADALLACADRRLAEAKRWRKCHLLEEAAAVRRESASAAFPARVAAVVASPGDQLRILVVDDDPGLRLLLRTTFEAVEVTVDEAESAAEAQLAIGLRRPDVIVLDVSMPGMDGLAFTRALRTNPAIRGIGIVLLTGGEVGAQAAREAGADLLLHKPFSPLELLAAVEQTAGAISSPARLATAAGRPKDQLLLYASDLRSLLEIERRQRRTLEHTYRETIGALASALESKDTGTGAHSQRVLRYATEIARAAAPELVDDPSVAYGFLLHDVGKIGIPDQILKKRGPLTQPERRVMQTHAPLGAQILAPVALLHVQGLAIVRHHHERWDGRGYPDGLADDTIPLGARIFAVADALDAMTSERPYRRAGTWHDAIREIDAQAGSQFDPAIIKAFRNQEPKLHRIHRELAAA